MTLLRVANVAKLDVAEPLHAIVVHTQDNMLACSSCDRLKPSELEHWNAKIKTFEGHISCATHF